jgi:hypothetical protein
VAVPPPVVTVIRPVVAPLGTVARICDPETTVKLPGVPLNFTAVAPLKFVPLIVTDDPTGPCFGENELIVGAAVAAVTVKLLALVAVPPAVVTASGPLVAPVGTVAVICVSELTANDDAVPLNVTELAPVNPVPVSVTVVPTAPLDGENEPIVGAAGGC